MGHSLHNTLLIGFSVIAGLVLLSRLTIAIAGGRAQPSRLLQLHRDQNGGVQSLSFVVALPIFIMLMMGIVQVSQLMIAQIVVEYAAIASARAAAVWIPAHVVDEGRNHIAGLQFREYQDAGSLYDVDGKGSALGYVTAKRARISLAAAQACLSISPSRTTGLTNAPNVNGVIDPTSTISPLSRAFSAIARDEADIDAIPARLRNKLNYAVGQTRVELSVFHPSGPEPPLRYYRIPDDLRYPKYADLLYANLHRPQVPPGEDRPYEVVVIPGYENEVWAFLANEIGWQDQITVVVHHNLALLPGPGRLLATSVEHSDGKSDSVAETIEEVEDTYTWPLVATATISNEGQKPVLRYEFESSFPDD